jgi:hypothetical protein
LLEGLRGNEKSVDANGNVTPHSLSDYIYGSRIWGRTLKQRPITSILASGDIILAHYPRLARLTPNYKSQCEASWEEISGNIPIPPTSAPAPTTSAPPSKTPIWRRILNKLEKRKASPSPPQPTTFQAEEKLQRIERYPCVTFPDKVVLGETIPLEVHIKATQLSTRDNKATTTITLDTKSNEAEIPVHVILEGGPGFEILHKYYATIGVPVKIQDSKPIIFYLKSKKEGLRTIKVRFYQENMYVGEIKIESLVVSAKDEPHIPSQVTKEWKSADKLPDKIIQGPDITMYIHEKRTFPDFEMMY